MSASPPSEADLEDLFDSLNPSEHGAIEILNLRDAITHLEKHYALGLDPADNERLYSYLCNIPGREGKVPAIDISLGVCREHFVCGMRRLLSALIQMNHNGITMQQMKILLTAAFDHFDTDQDGHISLEELIVAAEGMGLQLQDAVLLELYHFLVPDRKFKMTLENLANEQSSEQKWMEAMNRSLALMYKKKGIDGIVYLMGRMQKEFLAGGTWEEKVQRALSCAWDGIDHVCQVLDLGLDVVGVGVALKYLGETLAHNAQSQTTSGVDLETMLPLLTLMSVAMVGAAKEINELVPREMTVDEAQLYSCVFWPRGFSQAEFRRLLACPGFCWVSAGPGDLLDDGDQTLRILVRGSAEVRHKNPTHLSSVLPPGSTIGETSFLHDRRLWDNEEVRARTPVFCASWDQKELRKYLACDEDLSMRLDLWLTETTVANFHRKVQLSAEETRSASGPGHLRLTKTTEDLFESEDDFASVEVFNGASVILGQALRGSTSTGTIDDAMGFLMSKAISKDGLSKEGIDFMMPAICKKYGLRDDDQFRRRLFAYLGVTEDGSILSVAEFTRKMSEMNECILSLKGLAIHEIESIMLRAFERFDLNGDGVISETEFLQIRETLHLPLSTEQARWLFSFFDVDKSGAIDYSTWNSGAHGSLSWADALGESWKEQAERKGFTGFHALLGDLQVILTGPGDMDAKFRLAAAKLSDSTETLAEVVNAGDDALSTSIALWGLWSSWDNVQDLGLIPFLLFSGLLAVKAVRRKAEGDVANLTEAEALLYATSFEQSGFTVSEFQQLLRCGNARWEQADAGDVVSSPSCTSLTMIACGSCAVQHEGRKTPTLVGRGGFVGSDRFLGADLKQRARATEPTTVLTLEKDALKSHLLHNESLAMRFNRIVAKSMVETFLGNEAV